MLRLLLAICTLALLVWTAATALTQVEPGERAVIRRFGRILETKPEPGLYIGWPWGIEQVHREKVNMTRSIVVGFMDKEDKEDEVIPAGQLLTGDHNLVNVQAVIEYKVREEDVEKYVLQKDNAEAFVARAAESLLAEWIASRKVDDVLTQGKLQLPLFLREQLPLRLRVYDLGIEIERASVKKLFPPEQVKDAFDRLAQAHININTRVYEAQQQAKRQTDLAAAKKADIQRQANTYASIERLNARTEAAGFLQRLEQYEIITRTNHDYLKVLWLDDMTRLFARMKDSGRIEVLDHNLSSEGISITQFPLQPKKK